MSDYQSSLQVNFDAYSRQSCHFVKSETIPNKQKTPKPFETKIKQRYFTAGTGINETNERNLLEEPSPFIYPKDLEDFAQKVMSKAWRTQQREIELSSKYNDRHNYRTRQQIDILNRLYVKQPDVKSLKMIQDIDPEFFKIIQGRPIKDKLDIRKYIETVRDVLKTKIIMGYREDDIMLIDESLLLEQKKIDEIKENYQTYVNTFEEFLFNDHTYSMRLLKESEEEALLAQEKYDEYRQLSKEYGALRSILYSTEEKWRNCKLYQRFLFLVSPMSWRKEHDYYFMKQDDMAVLQEVSTVFGKYRLNMNDQFSLEDLIHQFLDDCQTQDEPKLFFTHSNQLLDVFRFMELQNLNSLLHSEELAIPLENVKDGMTQAEKLFNAEIAGLEEAIEKLAGGISWEEERAKVLEKLAMELINGEFKNLVVHEDVLNLHVFVEDVYETRIGANDANLTAADMMKAVEEKFRDELIFLDQMPSEQVAKLERNCYAEEARMLKIAKKAARKLMEFETLFKKLQKVFAPPFVKSHKALCGGILYFVFIFCLKREEVTKGTYQRRGLIYQFMNYKSAITKEEITYPFIEENSSYSDLYFVFS